MSFVTRVKKREEAVDHTRGKERENRLIAGDNNGAQVIRTVTAQTVIHLEADHNG